MRLALASFALLLASATACGDEAGQPAGPGAATEVTTSIPIPTSQPSAATGVVGLVQSVAPSEIIVRDGEGDHRVTLSAGGIVRRAQDALLIPDPSLNNIRAGDAVSVHGATSGDLLIADVILLNFFSARPVDVVSLGRDGFMGLMSFNRGDVPQEVLIHVDPSFTIDAKTHQPVDTAVLSSGQRLTVESYRSSDGSFVAVSVTLY